MRLTRFYVWLAAGVMVVMPGTSIRADDAHHNRTRVTVFATGLNDPRGLAFDSDGNLYVAEAGTGGSTSTAGMCDQVLPPVGPKLGGATGRIVAINRRGAISVVAQSLPSSQASPLIGGDKEGAAAVTFSGNRLFGLISGGGCSHGQRDPRAHNGIISINRHGVSLVADLSAWLLANPGAKGAEQPRSPDYEPDGTWYSMLSARGQLYAVEPNHGLLVSADPSNGHVELVNDLFATFGDHTYTTLARDRGDLYVGTLGQIAFVPGLFPPVPDFERSFQAGIYRVSPNGAAVQVASGLHAVLGIAFDGQHRMYVLQSPIFVPGTGSLVRLDNHGHAETLVTGLNFPSALVRGPDGAFYISACGYHCGPGEGGILRVSVGDAAGSNDDHEE
jgi:sugar lactone lactonase YvrE